MTPNFKSLTLRPWLSLALVALILLTRFKHEGSATALPDATLAAFFLAGMWIASGWLFGILLAVAALADQMAFAAGVSDWCVTAAYAFLIPTYGAMWWGGKLCRDVNLATWQGALGVLAAVVGSSIVAFAISNGSFFWLSGYFPNMSLVEYWSRTIKYFPWYMGWAAVYVTAACAIAVVSRLMQRPRAAALDAR